MSFRALFIFATAPWLAGCATLDSMWNDTGNEALIAKMKADAVESAERGQRSHERVLELYRQGAMHSDERALMEAENSLIDTKVALANMDANVARKEEDAYTAALLTNKTDLTELCVRAGMVANAYLNANMADRYETWKYTERRDCSRAKKFRQ